MLKTIKSNRKLRIITIMVSLILIWMASGVFKAKVEPEGANISTENKFKSIESAAEIRTKYLSFSALASASNAINLTPQITGTVIKTFVNDGDILKAGDKIVQLTNDSLIKRVAQMNNAVASARLQYLATNELWKKQLGSQLDLDNAAIVLKTAEADLVAAKTDLDNSIIVAPFDGMIDELTVQEGDIVSNVGAGYATLGRFIDLRSIEAKAYLSQLERSQIITNEGGIIVKNQNESIPAKVTFISQAADEQTGTFLVKAVAENSIKLVDGEAVTLKIKIGDVKSHNVPISALMVDNAGDLAINTIDSQNQVQQFKVTLVDEDDKGMWISGLPEQCKIVLASQ